jgi:protein-disulfide isomerase
MRTGREWLLDVGTITMVTCALVVTVLAVRREHSAGTVTPSAAAIPQRQADWETYAADGHSIGDSAAAVTIVEFADFECPYCRRFAATIDSLRANKQSVRIVFRHFPIAGHRFAIAAARASECAGDQGRFEQMHRVLYANQDSLGLQSWIWFGRRAGVADTARFNRCVISGAPIAALARDTAAAHRLGVRGTPTLLLNGWRIDGVPKPDSLKAYIERARTKEAIAQIRR